MRLVGLAEIFPARFIAVSEYGHSGLGAGDSQSCELTGAELALYGRRLFAGFDLSYDEAVA
jgi:hypothetical protein